MPAGADGQKLNVASRRAVFSEGRGREREAEAATM